MCSNVSAYYTVLGSPRKITLTLSLILGNSFSFLSDFRFNSVYQECLSVEVKFPLGILQILGNGLSKCRVFVFINYRNFFLSACKTDVENLMTKSLLLKIDDHFVYSSLRSFLIEASPAPARKFILEFFIKQFTQGLVFIVWAVLLIFAEKELRGMRVIFKYLIVY